MAFRSALWVLAFAPAAADEFLQKTRDLQQQQKSSGSKCCGQAPGGVPGSCWAPDWCSNPLNAWCSQSQDHCENNCNGVFCPGVGAVEAALAAEEITTELLAAEVVNTTTAGFTTGGLAETQDLQQQQKSSGNRCCGQAPGGVPGSCGAPDWCSNPLDAWCSQSQDRCEKHCNGVFCPGVGAVEAALAAEEITTELLAAEVVNTTAAGFTTGGLAEAQDLPCGSYNSDDCESEFHHGLGPFCSRCSNEGGNNPLRNRCHLCCTEC